MSAKPALTDTGERLYEMLAPTFFKEDEKYGWPGVIFVSAFAKMIDPAAEIVQPINTLTLGQNHVTPNAGTGARNSGEALFTQYVAKATGALKSVSFVSTNEVSATNSCTSVQLGVYSDSGGFPSKLLGSGTFTGTPKNGQLISAMISGVTLTVNQKYWLAILPLGGKLYIPQELGVGKVDELTHVVSGFPNALAPGELSNLAGNAGMPIWGVTNAVQLPGFSILFNPYEIPSSWLEWLSQWVGVDLSTSPNDSVSREWIAHPIGYERGTEAAMRLKAEATMTGAKTLFFYVRYSGEAYVIKAAALESCCPNPKETQEAIESVMPAWSVLKFERVKGGTIGILEASHAEMSGIEAAHGTMEDLELHPEK